MTPARSHVSNVPFLHTQINRETAHVVRARQASFRMSLDRRVFFIGIRSTADIFTIKNWAKFKLVLPGRPTMTHYPARRDEWTTLGLSGTVTQQPIGNIDRL